MQKHIFVLLSFVILIVTACSKNDKGETQYASMTTTQQKSAEDCGKEAHHICNQGLAFAKLGDSLAGLQLTDATIKQVKDTILSTEDYTAFGKILTLQDGTISIESTPIEKGESNDDITKAHVGAIRIQSPTFATAENIKVGSTFAQLKSLYPDSLMVVQPGEEKGEIEIKVPTVTRIYYTLKQGENQQEVPGAEGYDVSTIASDAKVSAIMVIQ